MPSKQKAALPKRATKPAKAKIKRPARSKRVLGSLRTAELADRLVQGISEGIPLRQLCRTNAISKSEVYNWIAADAEFAGRIARAREEGYDAIAEECLDIADDARNDWMERVGADGETGAIVVNTDHIQRSKLRIETRLKLLAKWSKKYADKIDHTVTGRLEHVSTLSEAELERIAASGSR